MSAGASRPTLRAMCAGTSTGEWLGSGTADGGVQSVGCGGVAGFSFDSRLAIMQLLDSITVITPLFCACTACLQAAAPLRQQLSGGDQVLPERPAPGQGQCADSAGSGDAAGAIACCLRCGAGCLVCCNCWRRVLAAATHCSSVLECMVLDTAGWFCYDPACWTCWQQCGSREAARLASPPGHSTPAHLPPYTHHSQTPTPTQHRSKCVTSQALLTRGAGCCSCAPTTATTGSRWPLPTTWTATLTQQCQSLAHTSQP